MSKMSAEQVETKILGKKHNSCLRYKGYTSKTDLTVPGKQILTIDGGSNAGDYPGTAVPDGKGGINIKYSACEFLATFKTDGEKILMNWEPRHPKYPEEDFVILNCSQCKL